LEIDRKVFETDEHAFIATTFQNIGSVLNLQGKYVEAFYCYKKLLKIERKVFDTDEHASISKTLQNIGSVLCSQEKYVEAFYYFNKSL